MKTQDEILLQRWLRIDDWQDEEIAPLDLVEKTRRYLEESEERKRICTDYDNRIIQLRENIVFWRTLGVGMVTVIIIILYLML